MVWLDVDGVRSYLAQGGSRKPSRKVVYAMVSAGMRVARVGSIGRRLMFCAEWIEAFLMARTGSTETREAVAEGLESGAMND